MIRNKWLAGLIVILFITTCVGCVSQAKRDFQFAKSKDSIRAYSAFLEKHPDSEFASRAEREISILKNRDQLIAQSRQEAQVKANRQNDVKMAALDQYKVGELTLIDFEKDGWNASDPHRGLMGIVGFVRKRKNTVYFLGTKKAVDMSRLPPNLPHPGDMAEAMSRPLRDGDGDAAMKPPASAKIVYRLEFIDGICRGIKKNVADTHVKHSAGKIVSISETQVVLHYHARNHVFNIDENTEFMDAEGKKVAIDEFKRGEDAKVTCEVDSNVAKVVKKGLIQLKLTP